MSPGMPLGGAEKQTMPRTSIVNHFRRKSHNTDPANAYEATFTQTKRIDSTALLNFKTQVPLTPMFWATGRDTSLLSFSVLPMP